MQAITISLKKEAISSKESREMFMGRHGGMKVKGEMMCLNYNLKKMGKKPFMVPAQWILGVLILFWLWYGPLHSFIGSYVWFNEYFLRVCVVSGLWAEDAQVAETHLCCMLLSVKWGWPKQCGHKNTHEIPNCAGWRRKINGSMKGQSKKSGDRLCR